MSAPPLVLIKTTTVYVDINPSFTSRSSLSRAYLSTLHHTFTTSKNEERTTRPSSRGSRKRVLPHDDDGQNERNKVRGRVRGISIVVVVVFVFFVVFFFQQKSRLPLETVRRGNVGFEISRLRTRVFRRALRVRVPKISRRRGEDERVRERAEERVRERVFARVFSGREAGMRRRRLKEVVKVLSRARD
jgi:hypothetical protein